MEMNGEDLLRMNRVLRHRLRNFASGLRSAVTLLSQESEGKLPERDMEYFPLMLSECDDIKVLTDRMSLLFDATSNSGLAEESAGSASIGIGDIMDSLMKEMLSRYPLADIRLTDASHRLSGKKLCAIDGLLIALREVVVNAVEFAKDRPVTIDCSELDGSMFVCVRDMLGGVAPENLDKLFLPFFTTRSKHVGIGLAIARKFIDNAGGSIKAENNEVGGLTVSISAPLEA